MSGRAGKVAIVEQWCAASLNAGWAGGLASLATHHLARVGSPGQARHARCTTPKQAGRHTARPNLPSASIVILFFTKSSWSESEIRRLAPSLRAVVTRTALDAGGPFTQAQGSPSRDVAGTWLAGKPHVLPSPFRSRSESSSESQHSRGHYEGPRKIGQERCPPSLVSGITSGWSIRSEAARSPAQPAQRCA